MIEELIMPTKRTHYGLVIVLAFVAYVAVLAAGLFS